MPSHRFQWNFAILKGLPQNSKRQTGFCFRFFSAGRYTAPPVFLGFHQGNRFKIGKCMKLSVRWYLANYTEGLHILLLHPKLLSHASISQFDGRLVNQLRQINDCVLSLFNSSKYLTTLRSNISPCQKATTLILIPLYKPSFHPWKPSKKYLSATVFLSWMLFKICDCDEFLSTTPATQFWL